MSNLEDARAAFIRACVWHGSLDQAEAILTANPEIAASDIYTAALLGDDAGVRRFLALDPGYATAKGGPLGWDALTHLCFSKYLRLDLARMQGFVNAATALLDAGASANTGFWEENHQPKPEWESALYGAAGVAQHAEMTQLLMERGADPNDEEVPYHSPETYDNAALKILVESGKLNADSQSTMLLRKADWHDYEGIKYLLEKGVDPNRMTRWGYTALHQAIRRDNALKIVEVMLDHDADFSLPNRQDGRTAASIAAWRGRGDVLGLLQSRGVRVEMRPLERLLAACALDDGAQVRAMAAAEPGLVRELITIGGTVLAEFSGTGSAGVRWLLELGIPVDALYKEGDGYFGTATNSTALHVAAWRAQHQAVKLLLDRGAAVNARDGQGRTALQLAVRACVDSYWSYRRLPESVEALLRAGASAQGIAVPCGYPEVDALLQAGPPLQ